MVSKVAELVSAGVAVVISTQCLEEGIDLGVYRVGRELARQEVIRSGDMTTQAAVMKLMWALANFASPGEVKRFMETPVCGDRSF